MTESTEAERKRKQAKRRAKRLARDLSRVPRRAGESERSHERRARLRGGLLRAGKRVRPALNDFLGRYSTIGSAPWFEPSRFPWALALEQDWESILKEAERVLQGRAELPPLYKISPDHSRIDRDDRWKVYFLKGYGFWNEEHCAECPDTARAVRRIPRLESAFFSILEPGKRIKPHRGPTRAIFTCHLALSLPREREKCWIEVDGIRRSWEPGKVMLFDDTYEHEVLNDTDEDRVVLLIHVRRPLRFPASLIGDAVFGAIKWSPFVQDGVKNQDAWKNAMEARRTQQPGSPTRDGEPE